MNSSNAVRKCGVRPSIAKRRSCTSMECKISLSVPKILLTAGREPPRASKRDERSALLEVAAPCVGHCPFTVLWPEGAQRCRFSGLSLQEGAVHLRPLTRKEARLCRTAMSYNGRQMHLYRRGATTL